MSRSVRFDVLIMARVIQIDIIAHRDCGDMGINAEKAGCKGLTRKRSKSGPK